MKKINFNELNENDIGISFHLSMNFPYCIKLPFTKQLVKKGIYQLLFAPEPEEDITSNYVFRNETTKEDKSFNKEKAKKVKIQRL
jgi:hypothetical protein